MHTQADISTSQINLGFEPIISLEEGIRAYIPEIRRLHGTDITWLTYKENHQDY